MSRHDGERWTTFTTTDGLASNYVNAISEDREGNLWFGTPGGVSRYDERWKTFTTTDGLASNSVWAMLEDSEGNLWFGTFKGVSRYDGEMWTTFTTADGLADNYVIAILEDREGNSWFGTRRGVSRYDGEGWTTYDMGDGLVNDWVHAILEDREGNLWFGTGSAGPDPSLPPDGGISRYDGETWTTYTIEDGLANDFVNVILEDSEGDLWFGTGGGGVTDTKLTGHRQTHTFSLGRKE